MADKGISVISHNGEDYNINDPNIAGEFYPNSNYAVGDHVTHEGKLYVFTAAHTGAWTGSDVTQVQIGAELHDYGAHAMVRYDVAQTLTDAQKAVARSNIAAANAELEDKIGTVPSGTTVENQIFAQGTQISTNASNIDALQRQVGTVPTGETVEGQITDLKSAIDEIEPGLTDMAKEALLNLLAHVVYIDGNGESYYNTFRDAIYSDASLVSISAVFVQPQTTIYTDDDINDLRQYLTVSANFDDGTSQVVNEYSLSGALTEGSSTITVSYQGKTTTFVITGVKDASYRWIYPSAKMSDYVGGITRDDDFLDHSVFADRNKYKTKHLYGASSGVTKYRTYWSPYVEQVDHSYEVDLYPVAIPVGATKVTVFFETQATGTTEAQIIRMVKSGTYYIATEYASMLASGATFEFDTTKQGDYACVLISNNSATSGIEVSNLSVVFE